MTQEWKAGSVSSSYKEVVKAKLDALTAEEVKKLPYEHGAREFHKWWDRIGLMSEKEDTIMEMDGYRIVVMEPGRISISFFMFHTWLLPGQGRLQQNDSSGWAWLMK